MPKIVFFGSSPFSCIVLEKLKDHIQAVVTKPDKPVGRHLKLTPNPVKVLAEKYGLPVHTSPIGGELGLIAAYGKIIKPEILDKFNGQIYNIHPSLLPKYRGPSPLQSQILDGVTDTGVTIIRIDAQMDHGPIVAVAQAKILPEDTTVTLGNRLFALGADLFMENLSKIQSLKLKTQDEDTATYTKLLTREDGFVEYSELENKEKITRMFRAFAPWPGVWALTPERKRVKVVALSPLVVQSESGQQLKHGKT